MTGRHWRVTKCWWKLTESRSLREAAMLGKMCIAPAFLPKRTPCSAWLCSVARPQPKVTALLAWKVREQRERLPKQPKREGRNPGKEGRRDLKKRGEPPNLWLNTTLILGWTQSRAYTEEMVRFTGKSQVLEGRRNWVVSAADYYKRKRIWTLLEQSQHLQKKITESRVSTVFYQEANKRQ